jgi:hypothetical protein
MQIVVMGRIVHAVARQTVHRLTVSRISRFLAHRVGDSVLVRVARSTQIDWIVVQQERSLAAVWSMAGRARQALPMGRIATFLLRFCSTGIVAAQADRLLVTAQQTLPVSGVRIVTARTTGTAG